MADITRSVRGRKHPRNPGAVDIVEAVPLFTNDANVKSLLHMNGANGSQTFTDDIGKTWTAFGNAQLSTAAFKFGSASGLFDGAGDYVETADHADFDVGSGNFTVDFWFKKAANAAIMCAFGQVDNAGGSASCSILLYLDNDAANHPGASIYTGSTLHSVNGTITITDTNWHHYALVRNGNTAVLYIDGTSVGTKDITGVTVNNSVNKPTLGRPGEYAGQYLNGRLDEFRFSKGVARWTANFTPPTDEYPNGQ